MVANMKMLKLTCGEIVEKPKWMLTKTGLWPTRINNTKHEFLKLLFSFCVDVAVLVVVVHNIINAIRANDMRLLNYMICLIIPIVNYIAKSCTLILNKSCFWEVLQDMESDAFNIHNEKLTKHVGVVFKISSVLLRYFSIAFTIELAFSSFLPLMTNVNVIVPSSFDTGRFDFLYKILHFFITSYMAYNSIGFDVLYLTLMGLVVAQLDILQERLVNVIEEAERTKSKNPMNVKIDQILRECVILQDLINEFVKKLSVLLSFPLFIQYTCGCLVICNAVLQLTLMRDSGSTNVMSMCAYTAITFSQMAAYHWLGNETTFKSSKIVESSYASKWYVMNVKSRKTLLLLMERAKRPLEVQVYNFITISLNSFGIILRWAYSVFSLIRARYN